MSHKNRYYFSAICALAVAVPALAQDVAPPANNSEQAILTWARNAKLVDDTAAPKAAWQMVGALDEGLLFATANPPGADGIAKVGIRLERFKPNGATRSEANLFDLDCGKQQIKATFDSTFAAHNLTGVKVDKPLSGAWQPVASNEIVAQIKDDACKAPARTTATAAPAAGAAAPINIQDAAAVRAWIAANGVRDRNVAGEAQWSYLNSSNEGVIYSALTQRNAQARTGTLTVRTERFAAAPTAKLPASLSKAEEFEINCRNDRLRKVAQVDYANRNMQGATDGERKVEEWTPIAEHRLLAKPLADLCTQLQASRDFVSGAAGGRGVSGRNRD